MNPFLRWINALAVLTLALSGCSAASVSRLPTAAQALTVTPIFPTAAPTLTPSPTPSPTFTSTALPCPTATPLPPLTPWPDPARPASSPEAQGLDSARLAEMLALARENQMDLHSLLIVRHGTLVMEMYGALNGPETRHAVYSITKSVVSALTGIAIRDGVLPPIETPLEELFPGREIAHLDDRKRTITLEHILSMTSGLEWRPGTKGNPINAFLSSPDPVQYVLNRPMEAAPGDVFYYNSGGSHLLSALIQARTGIPALDYAYAKLFGPVGIQDVAWASDPNGINWGGSDLWLRPRDIARFGLLYLQGGRWNGQQVVPADWVTTSTRHYMRAPGVPGPGPGYGYQWWVSPGGYSAIGFGGQYLFVLPAKDMLVVITSATPSSGALRPEDLLRDYILPAASNSPLPENPSAFANLQAEVWRWQHPTPETVPPLPETADQISGCLFEIKQTGGSRLTRVTLTFDQGSTTANVRVDGGLASFEGPAGLDGIARPAASNANIYLRGGWVDATTFELRVLHLGDALHERWRFTFDGDTISGDFESHGIETRYDFTGSFQVP